MIWEACQGEKHIGPVAGNLFRLVENQEQIATMAYVDTLEEQALLEDLLEQAKPPYPEGGEECLHYLLKTPFRYPPLPWGSRFGSMNEPGIFYGGADIQVTLAESAYYRFVFLYSMAAEPPTAHLRTGHTLFSVPYDTARGLRLQHPPFDAYRHQLAHPRDYSACQRFGSAMRGVGVEVFEYFSARDPAGGICVGLFTPQAFAGKSPCDMTQWLCETSTHRVAFKQIGASKLYAFTLEHFLFEGKLPFPA